MKNMNKNDNSTYRISPYNFLVENNDRYLLLYNSFSNGFIEFVSPYKEMVKKILKSGEVNQFVGEDEEKLKENLLRGGMIHEAELNQLDILKVRNRKGRYNSKTLGITMVMTLNCNFSCFYCIEERQNIIMDDNTRQKATEFIIKNMKDKDSLHITHYGGEPLLMKEKVFEWTEEMQKLAHKNNWKTSFGMITNGYLLSKDVAETMKKLNINSAQITLDGTEEMHNKRRPLISGKGTFDTIIKNIRDAKDLINIDIRVNVDKLNKNNAKELVNFLEKEGIKNKIGLHFAPVKAYTPACGDISFTCLGDRVFSKTETDLARYASEKGFDAFKYPTLKYGFCGADAEGAFVIGPQGNLYKCWNEVSYPEDAIGNVHNTEKEQINNKIYKWLAWDPFEKSTCVKCKLLPICMSGCPYNTMRKGVKGKGDCLQIKYNLEDMLKLRYLDKKRKQNIAVTAS